MDAVGLAKRGNGLPDSAAAADVALKFEVVLLGSRTFFVGVGFGSLSDGLKMAESGWRYF